MLKVYIDASTKGNPGPSGGGILIVYQGKQEQLSIPLSVGTNHQAEFEVFLKTLEFLKNKGLQNETIFCFSDSKTLVSTVDKTQRKTSFSFPISKNQRTSARLFLVNPTMVARKQKQRGR